MLATKTKKILIVNAYFDELRLPIARRNKVPLGMAPAYLAGAFSRERCEIRLHDELSQGPLLDEALLAWPDMLVLTGLNTAFDRMLHLTAYARTKNPRVIVVAGGPAIRALPQLSKKYFDYCCAGDVEQMQDVIRDSFSPAYVADEMCPRFDLVAHMNRIGYAETSRNCNFRCSFCTLTAQGRGYKPYSLDAIERQIAALGRRDIVVFLDNNFYGNDSRFFHARMGLLRSMYKAKRFGGWSALVTNDFFLKDENLSLAREAGCKALFSGVESFDAAWLQSVNKSQNTRLPQVEPIRKCLDAGIVFLYGLMLDPATRRIADMRREIDYITHTPEITLPSYLSVPIPMLGTPFFKESLAQRRLLPNTKLRDLDSTTLCLQTLDSLEIVAEFVRDLQNLRGHHAAVLSHSARWLMRYGSRFSFIQKLIALSSPAILCAPALATAPGWMKFGRRSAARRRTHISTTEPLDALYTPAFTVDSRYENYFQPTMLTDFSGALAPEVSELDVRTTPRKTSSLVPVASVA